MSIQLATRPPKDGFAKTNLQQWRQEVRGEEGETKEVAV